MDRFPYHHTNIFSLWQVRCLIEVLFLATFFLTGCTGQSVTASNSALCSTFTLTCTLNGLAIKDVVSFQWTLASVVVYQYVVETSAASYPLSTRSTTTKDTTNNALKVAVNSFQTADASTWDCIVSLSTGQTYNSSTVVSAGKCSSDSLVWIIGPILGGIIGICIIGLIIYIIIKKEICCGNRAI